MEFAIATLIMGRNKDFEDWLKVNNILLLEYKFIKVSFTFYHIYCLIFQGH
jgi:hypothetical protein